MNSIKESLTINFSKMESITDLIDQFIETARCTTSGLPNSDSRQADLMYELDSLVSDFLDQNQLSTDEFVNLERQILNTIAEDLIREGSIISENDCLELNHDESGNFDAESVLIALDSSIVEASVGLANYGIGADGMISEA